MGKLNDCFASADGRLTVDDALKRFSRGINSVGGEEEVGLKRATNRILSADIVSEILVPPKNNSAVDGYLVYFDDLSQESDTILPLTGRVSAGHPLKRTARRGEALSIFTGAQIPSGGSGRDPDTIFMIEDVKIDNKTVLLPPGQIRGANIRLAGEDVNVGDTVLKSGHRLRPQDVGMLAALGFSKVPVCKRLRVAVFSTGDEIKDPECKLGDGSIFDINRFTLLSLLEKLGCQTTDIGILPDDFDSICGGLKKASETHDLLITSGGVSKGEEDYVRSVVKSMGQLHTWNLLIKPGRPIALGHITDSEREIPLIGLPGNPVAVLVTFMIIARPIILLLSGASQIVPKKYPIKSGFSFSKKPGRREWLRASINRDLKDELQLVKFPNEGSGILSSMVESDGLIELGEDLTEVSKGQYVEFLPFGEVF